MGKAEIIINGIDLIGLVQVLNSVKNKYAKITLNNIEDVFRQEISDSEKFKLIRKYVLDGYNDELRTIIRTIFDDEV